MRRPSPLRPASVTNALNKAALFLTLAVILGNAYRHCLKDVTDPYKCDALLNHGQWLDPPDRTPDHNPFKYWSPPGCILHEYQGPEIAKCNEEGKLLIVGDAGTRQIFWATARKIEGDSDWVFEEQAKLDMHGDIEYSNGGANLKFLWDPWLNSSALHEELGMFRDELDRDDERTRNLPTSETVTSDLTRKTVAILIGGGLWYARHYKTSSFAHFKMAIDNIATSVESDKTIAKSLFAYDRDGVGNQIFFAPVIEPQYARLSPAREATIVPEKINAMNEYLPHISTGRDLHVLWSYAHMTRDQPQGYGESGLHVVENIAFRMADIFLNLRCNAKAAQREGPPMNGTCCNAYRPASYIQIVMIVSVFVLLPSVSIREARRAREAPTRVGLEKSMEPKWPTSLPASMANISGALLNLLLAACYCFVVDRTQVFDKLTKQPSVRDFKVLLGVSVGVCLLTTKSTTNYAGRRRSNSVTSFITNHAFLPRSQSNEFKGWMQLYILFYNYAGLSDVLEFYEVFRTFLAVYLFLSGYGHTMYFLQTKDYSSRRVAIVLLRLNTLPILLSFMLDRPYASYHFAPLVSFYFVVIYMTLRTANHRNGSVELLLWKLLLSALAVTCFIQINGMIELLSWVSRILVHTHWSVEEWRYHLGIDQYIVYVGMLVAVIHMRVSTILNTPQSRLNLFEESIIKYFGYYKACFLFVALFLGPVFWSVSRSRTNGEDYDWWMPFLSWMPVLSMVILRNATRTLRLHHCTAFAWLGRMSLEISVLSQHGWLAGDGQGLLRVGFRGGDGSLWDDKWRDLLILTPILLWCAWRVSMATKGLAAAIVGRFF